MNGLRLNVGASGAVSSVPLVIVRPTPLYALPQLTSRPLVRLLTPGQTAALLNSFQTSPDMTSWCDVSVDAGFGIMRGFVPCSAVSSAVPYSIWALRHGRRRF